MTKTAPSPLERIALTTGSCHGSEESDERVAEKDRRIFAYLLQHFRFPLAPFYNSM
jgi:hypothetical protein